ncbi:MAG: LSU m5C1962 methyltransferase RlmI [Nitrospira sp.]|nr:MAG: LSU m5C1962 methyltransferase RlmI [Nitrospira sp.]
MTTQAETSTGRVTLLHRMGREGPGHLWLYAGHAAKVEGQPVAGDVVDVVTPAGRFYGRGFYNPESKIRVRFLTFDDIPIDRQFWLERMGHAVRLRQRIVTNSTAYRLIHGEGDRLPGLIVDRYDQALVMQTLAFGMDRRKAMLADLLAEVTGLKTIYLRNDPKSRTLEGLPLERGFAKGSGATTVEITEGQAVFRVDMEFGQKTGWFCDQRENRLAAARYANGAEVLEAFCHTGAFGIHAALAGATSVEGLDVSEDSLAIAQEHARRNRVESRCRYRAGDAFDELRALAKSGKRYDMVMLDPPAFARSQQAVPKALTGYKDINLLGIKLTKPEGFVVTSSCSHHISDAQFWDAIRLAARDAKREVRLIEQRGQSGDHPILASMPETRYLKCLILQIF